MSSLCIPHDMEACTTTAEMDLSAKMTAVTIVESGGERAVRVDRSYPRPVPAEGEALLQVLMAGICGTDVEIVRGYKRLAGCCVLGHEFVARVAALPQHCDEFAVGDRVVAEINCVPEATAGPEERAQDPRRTALGIFGRDGCFAEYCTVPVENLHKVPWAMPDRVAVFVEPTAAACQILKQVDMLVVPNAKVAVLGAGRLGWLIAAVLVAHELDVVVVTRGHNQERNEKLARGLDIKLTTTDEALEAGGNFDFVVDCTGSREGFQSAVSLVRPRGTIVLKSTVAPTVSGPGIDLTAVVVKEITVVGSRCGPFVNALKLLRTGAVNPLPLISNIVDGAAAEMAFEAAEKAENLKILLEFAS